MFRAQANPMDDAVVKATDENLINENWELILDVCDRVSASPSGPQQAVASLIKRLAHRNANVQLYTLELANALSQNCGPTLHRELASRAFTEALLRLVGDRNTHAQVKQKVLERMGTWTEDFGKAPEYGIMEQAYQKLRTSQPSLLPPSKPGKREISSEDRQKEDDELQMALALSVQDSKTKVNGTVKDDSNEPSQASAGATQQGTTAATVSRVRALYDFTPSEQGELAFRKDDVIAVLESVYKDWWKGSLRGQTGIFPLNYVEKLQDPTKDELERDAQMEAEVFGEIKNVEKLLALLSVRAEGGTGSRRNEQEEDQISELYQRTLSIRPKLIELIGKYSQKKDDFTQLNEKFIKARRDYEALLDSSMSQPQQYQQYPIRQRPAGPMYPQGQAPYSGQQSGYIPPQAQSGYGPQYPSQNQVPPQHLSQQQQQAPQDPAQRFYSPAPQAEPAQQGYAVSPYSPAGPPAAQGGPAAFHFLPGGVPNPAGSTDQLSSAVRRKPSPQTLPQHQQAPPPSEMGLATTPSFPPQEFQGQIRPGSIHTLNSGNPQELATGGYESPTDNRRSYPPAATSQPVAEPYNMPQNTVPPQGYHYPPYSQAQRHPQQSSYPPQDVVASAIPAPLQPQRNDLSSLPSRQRTESFESTPSLYSVQQPVASEQQTYQGSAPPHAQQMPPAHPSAPPPSIPGSPPPPHYQQQQQQQVYQSYQAYNPHNQPQTMSSAPTTGDDPGDYYR